jgi:dTDP-4-amino-4,6-dideoxygalactose transaminase
MKKKIMKITLSDFGDFNLNIITQNTQKNNSYILGPSVSEFEKQFAEYTESEVCVATGNCTDSLRMCLQVYGIGPGSRVAVPSFTWLSTAEVVKQLYATPVFVDVDDTLCMDPSSLADIIDAVDAVIYVNLFGNVAQINQILDIAGSVPVIEDNAQGTGAKYMGRHLGYQGILSCYSFYPTKNLATLGDAGGVTGPNELIEPIRKLRNHGQANTKFNAHTVGWNSRMDSIHADILLNELPKLDSRNSRRRQIAQYYKDNIRGVDFQTINPDCEPVYHQFALLTTRADRIAHHLHENDIQTRCYYRTPIHTLPAYSTGQRLPCTENYGLMNVCIPVHPYLSDSEVEYITEKVNECV